MKRIYLLFLLLLIGCPKPLVVKEPSEPQIIVDTMYVPIPTFSGVLNPGCDTGAILTKYANFTAFKVDSTGRFWAVKYDALSHKLELVAKAKTDTSQTLWAIIERLKSMNMIAEKPPEPFSFLSKLGLVLIGIVIGVGGFFVLKFFGKV